MSITAKEILKRNNTVVQLIRTINSDDEPIYVYLMLSYQQWKKLEKRLACESVDLSKEGTIIAYGRGHEPDDTTKEIVGNVISKLSH